ncbi:MAG: hypothetical protein CVV58_07180, partial [Tenericutes bacterium HGW-Tenericutes-3]
PLKKWFDLLSNDVSKSIKNLLEKICKNQQETSYQINQDSMDYQLFFKPLIHEQKTCEIIGYIYQVGALEKQIHPTEDKLSILSNMTHEIRTPVNAIKGYSELLEETDLNDTQKEYLDHLQDTSKHLLKIVNDILDYSKLEAGKMQIENKPFKIKKLLDEVHSMLIEQTKQKQLYLDVMNIDCPNTVIGDAYRIRQILINFVSNASKFTEIGGISLTCYVDHKISENQLMIHFKVKDTGIGISEKDIHKVFKAFDQANESTTRLYGGTGLGLNISMKIAHLMHGDITLESKVNEGTTFILSVPLEYNPITSSIETALDKKPRLGSLILLAEDNPLNQKLSKRILTNLGMKVVIAHNGFIATTQDKDKHFDLILMDLQMPVMDGYEATRIIRKRHPNVPIIALSSESLYDQKENLIANGFSDAIEKPVDPALLLSTLIKWIPED